MRVVLPLAVLALLAACASDSPSEETGMVNSAPAPVMADAAGSTAESDVAR
jgi:hypothetical protein